MWVVQNVIVVNISGTFEMTINVEKIASVLVVIHEGLLT